MMKKAGKYISALLGLAAAAGAVWWAAFGLRPYDLSPTELQSRHALAPVAGLEVRLDPLEDIDGGHRAQTLRFISFDGREATGRIVYPRGATGPVPVLLGLHGMGRNHHRWWQAEFKERPTIEQTQRITALALSRGYAVLALDAREHGDRKNPDHTVRHIMRDLHLWGRREAYERMVVDTVKDYRVLLDWAVRQPTIDARHIRAAGYSMGAQMALLLGGLDTRIEAVAAIVPPYVDDKLAAVSPQRLLAGLAGKTVWLLSADDDEHASAAQNQALFDALPGTSKQHLRFPGGHVLPEGYVERLRPWF
ncbi:alpha/beta fold hydrolase [Roseateles sp.]|uniref:alpha/beta hydrolase family protein n=1 Tax=Roseateles sp. TaxID=1971397 RepID=UPI003262F773